MGAVIIVVTDVETGKVGEVLFAHFGNHVFRRNALFLRGKHHGRAVGVVGAAVVALVAAQFFESAPKRRFGCVRPCGQGGCCRWHTAARK